MFDKYLDDWALIADGEPIVTSNSHLLPVRMGNTAAMLKISRDKQEIIGGLLMQWWDGNGAARVFARRDEAILMERAQGTISLAAMARSGEDEEACKILCAVAERLHVEPKKPIPAVTPLSDRFSDLLAFDGKDGILGRCARAARAVLAEQRDIAILHGDLHHENVLDFRERGWLAIDPKGLRGERYFDYANIFCNPDLSDATYAIATQPNLFESRLGVVTKAANLDRSRLLHWILAWAGLSAVWILRGGVSPETSLSVARLAATELSRF